MAARSRYGETSELRTQIPHDICVSPGLLIQLMYRKEDVDQRCLIESVRPAQVSPQDEQKAVAKGIL